MKYPLITLLLLTISNAYAQRSSGIDLFSLRHIYSPNSEDFDFHQSTTEFTLPKRVGNNVWTNSVKIDYLNFDYKKEYTLDLSDLNSFYKLEYSSTYSYNLENNWSINGRIMTMLSTNAKGPIESEDFLINGGVLAIKKWKTEHKSSRLTFGLFYTTTTGRPLVLPFAIYSKQINEQYSYILGFPKTSIQYQPDETHTFALSIRQSGIFSNLTGNNLPVVNGKEAKKVEFSTISSGFEYAYFLKSGWRLETRLGYSILNTYKILDEDLEELFDFDTAPRVSLSLGISYDLVHLIRKKKQEANAKNQ